MCRKFARIARVVVLVSGCLLAVDAGQAQGRAGTAPTEQEVVAKVEEYLSAAVRVSRFSGSVLLARAGRPLFRKGYGLANQELDVPNTPETVFRVGSITKAFTATAVMMLQERGKLRVDDRICSHLGDCPAAWQPVTIRHLLAHTSGITSFTDLPDYPKTMALQVTHESLIARFRDRPLEFTPGEKYKYSNSGYYLLGVIIERVSGRAYADFLQEHIFRPLDMTSTGYDSSRRIIKHRASGYVMQGASLVNALPIHMSIPYAAGALISTVDDLLRWDQALYTEKLLSRASFDEMFTPWNEDFGYGWAIRKRFDRQVIEHGGGVNGFSASVARFPAERVAVIVLGNNASVAARSIANDLSAIVLGAPYQLPQERKAIAVDAGTPAR